jgi:hypothetical protein
MTYEVSQIDLAPAHHSGSVYTFPLARNSMQLSVGCAPDRELLAEPTRFTRALLQLLAPSNISSSNIHRNGCRLSTPRTVTNFPPRDLRPVGASRSLVEIRPSKGRSIEPFGLVEMYGE